MKQARDILDHLLHKMGIAFGSYPSFYRQWSVLVGEKIGEQSRIKDIVNNNLIIEVFHPGTTQLIQLNKDTILKKIKQYYPELGIETLKIVVVSSKKKLNDNPNHEEQGQNESKGVSQQSETITTSGTLEEELHKLQKAVEDKPAIDRE